MLADEFHVLLTGRYQAVGLADLNYHRCLSDVEVFYWDGLIKGGIDEFLLLSLQLQEPLLLAGRQRLILLLPGIEAGSCGLAHLLNRGAW